MIIAVHIATIASGAAAKQPRALLRDLCPNSLGLPKIDCDQMDGARRMWDLQSVLILGPPPSTFFQGFRLDKFADCQMNQDFTFDRLHY